MIAPNIPRLYTALAEWLACMVCLGQCPRRLTGRKFWLCAVAALAVQCAWLCSTGSVPVPIWIPCMAVAAGLMFTLFTLCCDIPLAGAGYCTIRAFLLAEFMAALEWQLYFYAAQFPKLQSRAVSLLFMVVIYGACGLLAWRLDRRWMDARFICAFRLTELWPPLVIALTAFLMSNLSFIYGNTPFSGTGVLEVFNIRTLVDLSGVVMLYAYHVQRGELFTRQELDAIRNILQNQYVQYRQSRESIDVINRKYHDLKHQIAVLRAEQDPNRRTAFLDEMEQEIITYEAQNKTGNSVLDTVLTSKSLYCARHQIELTCVANGHLLDFINVMDICTIFGNALDNAIEYALTIPDKERRLIHMTVFSQKGFLIIRVENYFEGTLHLQDGLPVTTKDDQAYHGFGIKSIRHTAEKYAGSVELDVQDNWFRLRILIPLTES